jgi:hypothetical protein
MGLLSNIICLGLILCIVPSSACNQSYHVTTGIENGRRFFLINDGVETEVRAITVTKLSENGFRGECIWGVSNDSDYVSGKLLYGLPLEKGNPHTNINICFDEDSSYQQNIIPLEKGREYELEIETSSSDTYTKFRFKH